MSSPNFYIGVWQQPSASFAKWKAEGVNLMVGCQDGGPDTPQAWRKAAADAGLAWMDFPKGATPAALLADALEIVSSPGCLQIMLPDEPSENQPWFSDPASQPYVDAWLAKWKPVFEVVKGKKPIWANFGSDRITSGRPTYNGEMVKPYVNNCHVTDLCFDCYPINYNVKTDWIDWNARTDNRFNGGADPFIIPGETQQQWALRCLQNFCPGLSYWSYIEVCQSTNNPNGRAPSGPEILMQADRLAKMGVKGFVYFAHALGTGLPWDPSGAAGKTAWDGRNPEEVAACQTLAATYLGAPGPTWPNTNEFIDLEHRVSALEASLAKVYKIESLRAELLEAMLHL